MALLTYSAIVVAAASAAFSYYVYNRMQKNFNQTYEELDELHDKVGQLSVSDEVINQNKWDEQELLEKNIKNLANKLSDLLSTNYGIEEATTYSEIVDEIQDMEVSDQDMKEEVIEFYNKVIKIEYSGDELDKSEKEQLKKTAVDLIRKTGQSLEEQK